MTWSPGFSRLNTCQGSGILPETPDSAEAESPIQRMSELKIQNFISSSRVYSMHRSSAALHIQTSFSRRYDR
jgi:hypothetical protein